MKKIGFVLPGPKYRPTGGYKIIFDYANYLAANGYEIVILYDCRYFLNRFHIKPKFVKSIIAKSFLKKTHWIKLEPNITSHIIFSEKAIDTLGLDLVFASAVRTTELVRLVGHNVRKGYLIQGFENWDIEDKVVYDSYNLDFYNITVAKWLYNLVKQNASSNKLFCCPNGIDLQKFRIINDIKERFHHSIAFLYHTQKVKGLEFLIPNISKWKSYYPNLIVNAFGSFKRPKELPDFVNYTAFANEDDLLRIYNSSAIFICSSLEEGFGLTGAESMACGCALITTDTNGCREYADESNSIIIPAGDTDAIFEAVLLLLNDEEKRITLATNGHQDIQKFSLQKARKCFLDIVQSII